MKTLIVYFSHVGETLADNNVVIIEKGNTEKVAEKIHSLIDSDLYKIVEAEPYPFNYMDCNNRARKEDQNNNHPELLDKVGIDISQYDTIYLGFPIWYRTYPRIVASFLDKYDFSGKTIVPFCTNDEEYFGIALLELQSIAKNATIKDGLVVRGVNVDSSDKEIEDFVNRNK